MDKIIRIQKKLYSGTGQEGPTKKIMIWRAPNVDVSCGAKNREENIADSGAGKTNVDKEEEWTPCSPDSFPQRFPHSCMNCLNQLDGRIVGKHALGFLTDKKKKALHPISDF